MKFSDIHGHDDIKQRLRDMADGNRLPHALLLEGPAGASKMMLARAFVQYLHCTGRRPGDPDSCGRCPSCRQHEGFNHPDLFFSYPVVKKGEDTVSELFADEWKKMLTSHPLMDFRQWLLLLDNINAQPRIYVPEGKVIIRRLNLTPVASEHKVVMMWLPERMQTECANKILKVVEEPCPNSMFVMVSDDSRSILPTIYSRLQRIKVPRYSDAEVAEYLAGRLGVEPDVAEDLSRICDGDLNRAVELVSVDNSSDQWLSLFASLMRLAYQRKVRELKAWSADVAALGREQAIRFLTYCQRLVRENFIINIHVPGLNSLTAAEAEFCSRFSPFVNERNVLKIVALFDNAITDIAANTNSKIVLFDVAMRMCMLIKL